MKTRKHRNQMNKTWLVGGALVLLVLVGLFAFSQNNSAAALQGSRLPKEVSVEQAHEMYQDGVFVLDVRQPEEWVEYHVPGTALIPLGELAGRLNELPRDQQILVVCRSGNRSAAGRDILLQAGFEDVTSMAGGLLQWRAAGYSTVSGE